MRNIPTDPDSLLVHWAGQCLIDCLRFSLEEDILPDDLLDEAWPLSRPADV